jgi:hypothetical protein
MNDLSAVIADHCVARMDAFEEWTAPNFGHWC